MKRWIVCLLAVHGLWTADACGGDYLLRIEAIGYVEQSAVEKRAVEEPVEASLHQIEVLARPGAPFHARSKLGPESITLRGVLQRKDDGRFCVELRYDCWLETGASRTTKSDEAKPLLEQTSIYTTATVVGGAPLTIASADSKTQQEGKVAKRSKIKYVLTLDEFANNRGNDP